MKDDADTTAAARTPRQRKPQRAASSPGGTGTWRLVYRQLRDDIVAMRRRPGDAVQEKQIALDFGISRTPVREATQRLADERLIEIFPQSGTFVARIPVKELPEAMVIRKALETTTARMAAETASKSQILALASIIEQQREASAAGDIGLFHSADEAFHARIAEISGYPGIWRVVLQVKTQVDRFRQLTLTLPRRMVVVTEDHEKILSGIMQHDPEAASRAMAHHLDAVLPELEVEEVRKRFGEQNFC